MGALITKRKQITRLALCATNTEHEYSKAGFFCSNQICHRADGPSSLKKEFYRYFYALIKNRTLYP